MQKSQHILPWLWLIAFLWLATDSLAATDTQVLDQYQYAHNGNEAALLQQAIVQANQNQQRVMAVFGAQWCHDSRGLSGKFSTPQMQTILQAHYQTVFIDVGFYQYGMGLIEQLGLPVYYGTPTVLILDPQTKQVLNRDSLPKWQAADSVPLAEYLQYFSEMATATSSQVALTASQQKSMQVLNGFEQDQAKRIMAGYQQVGPLLELEVTEQLQVEQRPLLDKLWFELRDFRVQVQQDMIRLRKEVRDTGSISGLPDYPTHSWE